MKIIHIKNTLPVLLLLWFAFPLHGQHLLNRKLEWNEATQALVYSFKGAVYPETENLLPYFSETFRAEDFNAKKISVQLVDPVFEKVYGANLTENQRAKFKKDVQFTQKQGLERGKYRVNFMLLPFRLRGGQLERLVSFGLTVSVLPASFEKKTEVNIPNTSVLKSGNWKKIRIPNSGIYKLTFSYLRQIGISQPEKLRIFGYGGQLGFMNNVLRPWSLQEQKVYKGSDFYLFYAQGPDTWKWDSNKNMFLYQKNDFDDYSYYFLTSDLGESNNEISTENTSASATQTATTYDVMAAHEQDLENLLGSGRNWFGESFDVNESQTFSFSFAKLVPNGACKVQLVFAQRLNPPSTLVASNSAFSQSLIFEQTTYSYAGYFAIVDTLSANFQWAGADEIPIQLDFQKGTSRSKGWLDYIVVNARAQLAYVDKPLQIYDRLSVGDGNVTEFQVVSNKELLVWQVDASGNVAALNTSFSAGLLRFTADTKDLKKYLAFAVDYDFPVPEYVADVANQNLHGLPQAQMLIVTHQDYLAQANELAAHHRDNDQLSVNVVTQQQIFNEFSSGRVDVCAIRDFVRMFYLRAGANAALMPKYLLLFGDGSYANRNADSRLKQAYVLTYQSENSVHITRSFVSDDFFGLLDEDEGEASGFLDIGIGRLPAKNMAEAENMLAKIKRYTDAKALGTWRNRVVFVADDTENNDGYYFMRQSEDMADSVWSNNSGFFPEKIYLDAYQQETSSVRQVYPEANNAIDAAVENGSLLINYVGHGSASTLANEQVVTEEQINAWNNFDKLTVIMSATCEFSRFDDYNYTSAGEQTLHNQRGGAVALFTTTRLVYAYPNERLNKEFFSYALKRVNTDDNTTMRLGDMLRRSKVGVGTDTNKRNFTLLGDPALRLAVGEYNVLTTQVNGSPVTSGNDTIRAMQELNVQGKIVDQNDNVVTGFNGTVNAVVYAAPSQAVTKGNDEYAPYDYVKYNNYVYRGKASVKNGLFAFSFVVPKDIRYEFGQAKISYYSENGITDAMGDYKQLVVGGSTDKEITDTQGPEIELFFNDEKFVDGGMTNQTPLLIAKLSDEHGINTLGTGIGHDIVAKVDQDVKKTHTLNDYFEGELDNHRRGELRFKLPEQTSGEHSLNLKVWDVFNNSAEKSIDFLVINSEKLTIEKLFNYPNPFTDKTAFFFKHNRPYEELEVLIRIYASSGRIVKTIETVLQGDNLLSPAIEWDGLDDFGDKIGRGVYFYQIKVRTTDGKEVDKFEKLLLLK